MDPRQMQLDSILTKLRAAHLVHDDDKGFGGYYSIDGHGHLLTEEELKLWIYILHSGSSCEDQECSGGHQWYMEFKGEIQ